MQDRKNLSPNRGDSDQISGYASANCMRTLPRLTYAGVFLLASSVILLQIALTRVYAIMLWHHLTYMVVSIALLGFGASGSLLTAFRRKREEPPFGSLCGYTLAYGLSIVLAFGAMRLIEIDSLRLWEDKSNLFALFLLYSITAVPFLFAGLALGTALTCFVRHVNKLYFFDLLGSGIGGAASVIILSNYGGSATIVISASIALLASFLLAFSASKLHRFAGSIGLAFGLLAFVLFSGVGKGLGIPHVEWHPPFAAGKAEFAGEDLSLFDRIYSATAEVEIGPEHTGMLTHGGNVGLEGERLLDVRTVGQDGTAPTLLVKGAGSLVGKPFVNKVQSASALVCYHARGAVEPDVLVIGVGGGIDVMVALTSGARSVTAAEINTAMVEMVTNRFDDYLDGLFRPGAHDYSDKLSLVTAEGRSFVRTQSREYDIIQMSGVDSFTALSTGAYTLSEAYLYTTEAVMEFYDHLKDGGYINYSRFILSSPRKPRETLRLANIACSALEQLGIDNPQSHLLVFQGQDWASTMIKKGPFTRAEVDALKKYANKQGFLGLLYNPLLKPGEEPQSEIPYLDLTRNVPAYSETLVRQFMPPGATEKMAMIKRHLIRGYPDVLRSDEAAVRKIASEIAAAFPANERPAMEAGATKMFADLYVQSVLPAKQRFAETAKVFHSLFAGDAVARRDFVSRYEYDISTCTDDRPFFFNYYRYSQLWDALADPDSSSKSIGSFTPDMPVGHIVLFASLIQITLLAALLIFLPLWRLRSSGVKTDGTWRYFLFFAALGMGFMFIEIVLMQKMVIFLGHPIYAVSVVLTSLLCSAGVGSLLAGRVQSLSRRHLTVLAAVVVGLVIAVCVLMNFVMPLLLGFSLPVRISAVALLIAPLGLALGMPFPTGMRIVEANCPELLPWCWAINGFLSVFSSVFCIVTSMVIGFSLVLVIAAVVYGVGFYALHPQVSTPVEEKPAL
ncbi:MAG: hypothetical protein VX951_07515 [Planctomycetota bacterium]|nr:hypothetical protein [Planctomycetota bacterium]